MCVAMSSRFYPDFADNFNIRPFLIYLEMSGAALSGFKCIQYCLTDLPFFCFCWL